MKKVLFLLIALLMIGSLAFAAGPSITIWGRTVLNLLWCNSAGLRNANDTDWLYIPGVIYTKWGPDSWTSMYGNDGMNMNININWDGDVMGYHLGFQFSNWDIFGDYATSNPAPPSPSIGMGSKVHTLYGSVKVVPDILSLKIGLISDSSYKYDTDVGCNWINNWQMGDLWAIPGIMLTFAPADLLTGLSVSLNYRVPLTPIVAYFTKDYVYKDDVNGGQVSDLLKTIDFMASYSIFDIGTFTLGTTGAKGTGWWDYGYNGFNNNYSGRPIFAGVQLRMIENMVIKIAGSYVIPDNLEIPNYPTTFDLASITYKVDPFTFKIGDLFYMDLYHFDGTTVMLNRTAAEIDLTLGDFFITLWGDFSEEYALSYCEGGPTIKYNPIGVQIGFFFKQYFTKSFAPVTDYEWSVPIQIDFGF